MKRHGYIIGGQVQGVGFRPFVYRAATRLRLTGHVGNTSDGVRVEVQGTDEALAAFAHALEHELPPLARITSLRREELPLADGEAAFAIAHSEGHHGHAVLVSPDVATCGNCLADMRDPANRRYRYPFTNCTDCGPRYTITHSIPYDRATTSMSCFPLCPDCAAEYNDPLDRRFHAQPNACPVCGPKVWLASAPEGDPRIPGPELAEGQRAIERTAAALRAGNIVAVKGLGGFHLVCDATSAEAIALLRERKCRPHKSLAIMVPDLETARRVACVSDAEAAVLASSERPIVVLASRGALPPAIAPDVGSIGVMLPYTPLHHLLLEAFAALSPLPALVMTSGNAGGEPISLGNREALARLRHIADLFLFHNRDILIRADDSVVRVESSPGEYFSTDNNPQYYPQKNSIPSASSPSRPNGTSAGIPSPSAKNLEGWGAGGGNLSSENALPRESPPLHFFRRARGFVPRPLELPRDAGRCVLATGGELKNTLCLTRGKDAFLSQHVGDLKNLETFEFFQNMAEHLGGLLEVKPEAIVCDLHPTTFPRAMRWIPACPSCACNTTSPMCTAYWRKTGMTPPRSGWRWTAPDTARTEPYGAENSSSSIPNPLARNAMADASAALRRSRCPEAKPPSGNRGVSQAASWGFPRLKDWKVLRRTWTPSLGWTESTPYTTPFWRWSAARPRP